MPLSLHNLVAEVLWGLLHERVTPEIACPGWVGWKDVTVARPYPKEFRDDVVRVARNRDDGVTIEQIAADFGVHPVTLWKWLRQADIDDGATSGKTTGESAELRELRRRNRLLEQENEVLRRAAAYLSQSNLPGKGFTRS
jgi:transposase